MRRFSSFLEALAAAREHVGEWFVIYSNRNDDGGPHSEPYVVDSDGFVRAWEQSLAAVDDGVVMTIDCAAVTRCSRIPDHR